MLIITSLRLLHEKSFGVKPVKTSLMILPEVLNKVAELSKEYGVSHSVLLQAGLLMLEDAHKSAVKNRQVTGVYNGNGMASVFGMDEDEEIPA